MLFLHIGAGKTGTTAIQEFCLLNRNRLKSHGIKFPKLGLWGESHHLLGHAWGVGWMPQDMMEKLIPSDIWHQAKRDYDKFGKDYLISSETLTTAFVQKPESMQEIKQIFKGVPIKVIFYMRRQDLHLESVYNQRIKTALTHEKLDLTRFPAFYNVHKFLTKVSEVFGRENIILRPYEKEQFENQNIFDDFLVNGLGIHDTKGFKHPNKQSNPRLSINALEFLRVANAIDRPWQRKLQFNKWVLSLSMAEQNQWKDRADRGENDLLSHSQREKILERYVKSNELAAKDFLGRQNGVLFFDDLPSEKINTFYEQKDLPFDRFAAGVAVKAWENWHENEISRPIARFKRLIGKVYTRLLAKNHI